MTGSATRSRENTRARLLEAAALVFAEAGLDGATVEAVCERAGFTRGAFYSNFESKDELFLELAGTVSAERLTAVRQRVTELNESGALAQDCDATTLVQQVMDTGSDDRLGVMLLSEIRLRALRDHAWGKAYLKQEQEMVAGIARIIEDIVASGTMSLRVEPEIAARMLLIVWEGMTVRGAMAGQDDAQLRRTGSTELGRLVTLLLG
ncbi:TetR/AcrR family transcriptional regulator [Microbacterium azadirachtae]|jgi:AcrR family transcriptional regulator|uniref:DNA-binding transcriptional regulator, AcrR family n=1 Tax=Microbacterium azadirachtae TaxID=582680 RepID=A0A0F0KZ04_9MICO|nr:TetR/AcrR family transcriptional regulator [Microbacterium azadirachtae]KJL25345.1 HTH-type transcriptional repressor AcnR [Microbacterium azadirachtae]UXW86648.1 TetR/AcrR family transcriptional regulator [Microbacterium azadirachtae]SDL84596.1 DNA-binding transcriptional regulator, AcrR family [Microbacterium azadirachtae]SEG22348.1 DNA-binding transcriptional regulator, AcrR family [Microbacterium azadirachtae]SEG24589.1 DNA-binding transcriptional regulator, AcrR family [Microbacterium 